MVSGDGLNAMCMLRWINVHIIKDQVWIEDIKIVFESHILKIKLENFIYVGLVMHKEDGKMLSLEEWKVKTLSRLEEEEVGGLKMDWIRT